MLYYDSSLVGDVTRVAANVLTCNTSLHVHLQDLLLAANDQPFRFPATFTFVVRSFTVLDGIGKSLDARFDISEISAPYARNLLLEGQPQVSSRGRRPL